MKWNKYWPLYVEYSEQSKKCIGFTKLQFCIALVLCTLQIGMHHNIELIPTENHKNSRKL